jgi:DNA invertase Pin-like site-specific DNA recombinase
MNTITVYQTSADDFREFIAQEAKKEVDTFLSNFSGVFVGPEDVARFHGVTKQTVYNHIKYGTLTPEIREKESGAIRFRLNEALKIDFKKLRKNLKYENGNT